MFCRDLEGNWPHHPHFTVDLHPAEPQTLWFKMSNLVMVLRILVHSAWHPLHHLPQQEVVWGWSLVTHQLQWGSKVLIASAGIGATAAFLPLLNSILKWEKGKQKSQKGGLRITKVLRAEEIFGTKELILILNLICIICIYWSYGSCWWVN